MATVSAPAPADKDSSDDEDGPLGGGTAAVDIMKGKDLEETEEDITTAAEEANEVLKVCMHPFQPRSLLLGRLLQAVSRTYMNEGVSYTANDVHVCVWGAWGEFFSLFVSLLHDCLREGSVSGNTRSL